MWILDSQNSTPANTIQTYTWKHGLVVLADNQPLASLSSPSARDILITTQPFACDSILPQFHNKTIIIDSCQSNKTIQTVQQLCQAMLQKSVTRNTTLFIKGGGMLLDLAGFVSAIYMRGIGRVVYVPTTLLAIVDATVGGKNGVNLGAGKNMLGVVRHAQEIRISLGYLGTLDDRAWGNGLGEVIKMALLYDRELFQMLQSAQMGVQQLRNDRKLVRQIVKRCIQMKIKVVESDQFDNNQRKWLNFGHTIGHAIELSPQGRNLQHGQCVGIGMLEQIRLGLRLRVVKDSSIYERVKSVLQKYNIPTEMPQFQHPENILKTMSKDKKNTQSGHVEFTLIQQIGSRHKIPTKIPLVQLHRYFTGSISYTLDNTDNSLSRRIHETNTRWLSSSKFPTSKSLSIRYLFLIAVHYLKTGQSVSLFNFLQSDDTFHIRGCLQTLGFTFQQTPNCIRVLSYSRKTNGTLNVGNSGLTARFVLPLCAYLGGEWSIDCHPRMSQRPNWEIFQFCGRYYECQFEWGRGQGSFPVVVRSRGLRAGLEGGIEMRSQESSQFVSSILLNAYLWPMEHPLTITLPQKIPSFSYITMTMDCLSKFNLAVTHSPPCLTLHPSRATAPSSIPIQLDLSSFSYPYSLSLIFSCPLPPVPASTQGDTQFYTYCQQLLTGTLPPILDFNLCTDTFMTFACIMATNTNNRYNLKHPQVRIVNIGNQRVKESNRIAITVYNLNKIGYKAIETEDGLILPTSVQYECKGQVRLRTEGDHRLAMTMSILALYVSGCCPGVRFVVDSKEAVNKTFPEFWQYLRDIGLGHAYNYGQDHSTPVLITHRQPQDQNKPRPSTVPRLTKYLLLGNRGCGKSTAASILAPNRNYLQVDLDQLLTQRIQAPPYNLPSIAQFITHHGWHQFRKLQHDELQKILSDDSINSSQWQGVMVAVGGGVVDWQPSLKLLKQCNKARVKKIYLERRYEHTEAVINANRPAIDNYSQVFKQRSVKYEQIADRIITVPINNVDSNKLNQFLLSQFDTLFPHNPSASQTKKSNGCTLSHGNIYVLPNVRDQAGNYIKFEQQASNDSYIAGVQIRLDTLLQQGNTIKQCRFDIAQFRYHNIGVIDHLSQILTLRTKQQYGTFPSTPAPAPLPQYYNQVLTQLRKIPTHYLDHQLAYLTPQNLPSYPKQIISYHGHSLPTINQLLQLQVPDGTLKKLCYDGTMGRWTDNEGYWRKGVHLCWNLNDPLTRLDCGYRMVRREGQAGVAIPTVRELGVLRGLARYFRRL